MVWTSRGRNAWLFGAAVVAQGLLGCSSEAPQDSPVTGVQALTATQERILSFEAPTTDWSSPSGIASSTVASHGAHSLSVAPSGWTELVSVPMTCLSNVKSTATLDVQLPEALDWGEVRLIVRAPSLGVHWEDLGGQPLAGRSAGTFHTLSFGVPAALADTLQGACSDLELRVTVNGPPVSGPYLFDRLDIAEAGGSDGDGDAAPGHTVSIAIPSGATLPSLFLSAGEHLQVDDRVTLAEASQLPTIANVGGGGTELGAGLIANGHVINGAGEISLRSNAHVLGSVTSGGPILEQNGVIIAGTRTEGANVMSGVAQWPVSFPAASGGDVVVGPDGPVVELSPGSYGKVDIRPRGKVSLRAGVYYLDEFNGNEPEGELILTGSPIVLYVRDGFVHKGQQVRTGGEEGQLLVAHLGTSTVLLQGAFEGTVVSPGGTIELRRPDTGQHQGSFFGQRIHVYSDSAVGFIPFDFSSLLCPLGDTDGDGVDDCTDVCNDDPLKTEPGVCGCGVSDIDSDSDGAPDCIDECPTDPSLQHAGICGCGDDPAPAGTPCDDGVCRGVFSCDGQGQCGDPSACAPDAGCEVKYFGGRDDRYYWFCPGPRSWDDALAACRSQGWSLAQLDSGAENRFVADNLTSPVSWIGANDRTLAGDWRWASVVSDGGARFWAGGADGQPYFGSFSAWAPGAPAGGSCGSVGAGGGWTATDCSSSAGFVCEVPRRRGGPGLVPDVNDACEVLHGRPCVSRSRPGPCVDEEVEFGPDLSECEPGCTESGPDACSASCNAAREQMRASLELCESACPTGDEPECATACTGAAQPPPPDSTCAPFDDFELDNCALESVSSPTTQCSTSADCPSGTVCGFYFACDAAGRRGTVSTCAPFNPFGQGGAKLCGIPVEGCPLPGDDPDFPELCEEVSLCGEAYPVQTVDDPFGSGADLAPVPFVPEDFFAEPPVPSDAPYPDLSNPCGAGGCSFGQAHPWCTLESADQLPSQEPPAVNKAGRTDGGLVSFDFDPKLAMEYDLSFGPFGLPDLRVIAEAGFSAKVRYGLAGGGSVEVLDAVAGLEATECRVIPRTSLLLFGEDYVPLIEEAGGFGFPEGLPSEVRQTACNKAHADFREAAGRAKKALRDAVELLRQYHARLENEDPSDNFGLTLCEQLTAQRPRGFPEGSCGTESPEETINRFIDYYESTATSFRGADGARGLLDIASNLKSSGFNIDERLNLYRYDRDEEITVAEVQFFIGPVPVNIEVLTTVSYGATFDAEVTLRPGEVVDQMLRLSGEQSAEPVALVKTSGGPTAGVGLGVFAGVGFGVPGFKAKIGLQANLNLGTITVPVHAGAGIGIGSTLDHRPPPPDLAGLVSGLPDLVPAKRYQVDLRYLAGMDVHLNDILSGDVQGRLKLKIAFFSKSWSKTLLRFDGICPSGGGARGSFCDLTLVSAAGSLDAAEGAFPWGAVSATTPFPRLARLTPGGSEPGSATADASVAEEFFYDSLCTCSEGGAECFRNDDCCDSNQVCFSEPGMAGPRICSGCRQKHEPCNDAGDCCASDALCNAEPVQVHMPRLCTPEEAAERQDCPDKDNCGCVDIEIVEFTTNVCKPGAGPIIR